MDINEIVEALNAGASADIWYDPDTFGNNNGEAEVIERAQNAMTEAAKQSLTAAPPFPETAECPAPKPVIPQTAE